MAEPTPIPFDAHRFVKRMTEAGMPAVQVEALADEQAALLGSRPATRADVAELAARQDTLATRADLAELAGGPARLPARQDTLTVKAGIAAIKEDLTVIRAGADLWIRMLSGIRVGVGYLVVRSIRTA